MTKHSEKPDLAAKAAGRGESMTSMELAQRIAVYLDHSDASYEAKLLHMAKMIDTELAPASRDHAAMKWRTASEHGNAFWDGEKLLVAVPVVSTQRGLSAAGRDLWDLSIITVHCDEDYFEIEEADEPWGWDWSDVEWWMSINDVVAGLPPLQPAAAKEAGR